MAKKTAPLLPATAERLCHFGDRLRLARLRRRLPAKQVAERSGMTPMTLRSLERGGSGVTMGAYLAVMQVLGIEKDLDLLGESDPVGRQLQDARLSAPEQLRTPFNALPGQQMQKASEARLANQRPKMRPSVQPGEGADRLDVPGKQVRKPLNASTDAADWIEKSGFASADALAGLIELPVSKKKKVR